MNESSKSWSTCRSHRPAVTYASLFLTAVVIVIGLLTQGTAQSLSMSDNSSTATFDQTMANNKENQVNGNQTAGGSHVRDGEPKYVAEMNTLSIILLVVAFIAFSFCSCFIYETRVGYFYHKWSHYERPKHNVLRVDTMKLIFVDDEPDPDKQTAVLKTDSSEGQKSSSTNPANASSSTP